LVEALRAHSRVGSIRSKARRQKAKTPKRHAARKINLVLNAVEAMSSVEAGARELLISTDQSETNSIVVAVRDSGPGVDPEDRERVFQAFYTTKSSGVGIGLSICRSIIEAHGGKLWADANEPRGAVFQFMLPNAETW
jgi:signal transduction histidine kinase